jgi:hypothetical protein
MNESNACVKGSEFLSVNDNLEKGVSYTKELVERLDFAIRRLGSLQPRCSEKESLSKPEPPREIPQLERTISLISRLSTVNDDFSFLLENLTRLV